LKAAIHPFAKKPKLKKKKERKRKKQDYKKKRKEGTKKDQSEFQNQDSNYQVQQKMPAISTAQVRRRRADVQPIGASAGTRLSQRTLQTKGVSRCAAAQT